MLVLHRTELAEKLPHSTLLCSHCPPAAAAFTLRSVQSLVSRVSVALSAASYRAGIRRKSNAAHSYSHCKPLLLTEDGGITEPESVLQPCVSVCVYSICDCSVCAVYTMPAPLSVTLRWISFALYSIAWLLLWIATGSNSYRQPTAPSQRRLPQSRPCYTRRHPVHPPHRAMTVTAWLLVVTVSPQQSHHSLQLRVRRAGRLHHTSHTRSVRSVRSHRRAQLRPLVCRLTAH